MTKVGFALIVRLHMKFKVFFWMLMLSSFFFIVVNVFNPLDINITPQKSAIRVETNLIRSLMSIRERLSIHLVENCDWTFLKMFSRVCTKSKTKKKYIYIYIDLGLNTFRSVRSRKTNKTSTNAKQKTK